LTSSKAEIKRKILSQVRRNYERVKMNEKMKREDDEDQASNNVEAETGCASTNQNAFVNLPTIKRLKESYDSDTMNSHENNSFPNSKQIKHMKSQPI
jgi:hypothetical protein